MVSAQTYVATTSVRLRSERTTDVLEAFCIRRANAFDVGEAKAHQRSISADAYLFLYKELVRLAGERTYCWPGLDYLVERLGTSEGTLKRWMKELENAELIQRKPRPGGQTSLTYITAYLPVDPGADFKVGDDDNGGDSQAVHDVAATAIVDDLVIREDQREVVPRSPAHCGEPTPVPVFFVPELEIEADRSAGSAVIPQTIKKQGLKTIGGNGGVSIQADRSTEEPSVDPKVSHLLRNEAILDPQALVELKDTPIVELEAVSDYLDKQTNVHCRPGLFVWLARHGFGARLLAGRQQHKLQRSSKGHRSPSNCTYTEDRYSSAEPEREPLDAAFVEVWQSVLDRVSQVVPREAFDVWIKPINLVILEDKLAVVAAPNVFVRQQIEQTYKAHLEEAFRQVCVRHIELEAVIG